MKQETVERLRAMVRVETGPRCRQCNTPLWIEGAHGIYERPGFVCVHTSHGGGCWEAAVEPQ